MVRTVKWFHWERRTCTQLNLKYTWDCQKGKEIIHGKESVYMEDGIRLMIFESSKLVPGRAWMVCYGAGKWRRQWHPTPVLLPGKSHGWRNLEGCSPWGRYELDATERLHFHFSLSRNGEGNGNPLQCSCLENPRDGGAWWAAVCGVTQSRTRLKRLSSSSSSNSIHSKLQDFILLPRLEPTQRRHVWTCWSFLTQSRSVWSKTLPRTVTWLVDGIYLVIWFHIFK